MSTPTTEEAPAPTPAAGCGDADGDNVIDACDTCDGEAETWNGIADYDGCPDTSGLAHGFLADPRNRFAAPYVWASFEPLSDHIPATEATRIRAELERRDPIERDMRIVCVGQAAAEEPSPGALAQRRAEALCELLREAGSRSEHLSILSVGSAPYLRDEPSADPPPARAIAQVLEAGEYLVADVVDGVVVLHRPAREDFYPPRREGCREDGRIDACDERIGPPPAVRTRPRAR